ncbi:hypothetical protein QFZ22_009713 [Streptomyces canus]|uniref:Transposase IS110-like N-terminal domain-containing protein n=1 Tax=Streptomyces canus TaxID=58343 RepID=A0AAW8FU63_9ACTN|nr:transposase [Streptomyces canus]MDQ0913641.1 hypothetical protein [Streptomyces canus]
MKSKITCGIGWAEVHHDVALVDETGKLVAKQRIKDDADVFRRLLALCAEAGDCAEALIPVSGGDRPRPAVRR